MLKKKTARITKRRATPKAPARPARARRTRERVAAQHYVAALPKPQIAIAAAKGRPMLTWVGKRPLRQISVFPAQAVEVFDPARDAVKRKGDEWNDWPAQYPRGGLLFHGDNKEVLAHLLANGFRGKVNLVYIDPPFDSGADYVRKVQLRGIGGAARLDGASYTLGEQIQYTDIWANDNYLQFMYERLLLLKELLAEDGKIALQCDWRKSHHLRSLLDEAFGSENLRGEILVRAGTKNVQSQFEEVSALATGNNTILFYTKSRDTKLPKLVSRLAEVEPGKWDTFWRGTNRPTMRYELFGQRPADGQWRWEEGRARKAVANYERFLKESAGLTLDNWYVQMRDREAIDLDFVRQGEDGTVQYYVPPRDYRLLSNVWFDLSYRGTVTAFPTEKSEEPLERLIEWLTGHKGLVLDCFVGSGTSAAVAQKLGRRWIGCDINKGAVQTTSKRLQTIIAQQIEQARREGAQAELPLETAQADEPLKPAQLSFSVYRVNDYDLQIQHNEAVNLACERIGITRTKADTFFDGTLGKKLVKITPFNHPLSPLDLEEVKKELSARPEEDRDIVVVCLGKESAVEKWLEEWNRLRKRGDIPNDIEIVELRTDAKYGQFFVHQPAKARVRVEREGGQLHVEIKDFISPTIVERLKQQAGVLTPQITDWRAMVDVVMIDPAYNGQVFNVALSDVPEKKTDLVEGKYTLPAPKGKATVAVKVIDMLGEEVLVTKDI